ncbi:hypothetical protein IWQ61_009582 [Dispira simplex]|nr:hypothetical protein IWQ61_009582 [Dispira simplex]
MLVLPQLPKIEELNNSPPAEFQSFVALFFESTPELSTRLYLQRPFASYNALVQQAQSILRTGLTEAEQVDVINAHPRLGEIPAKLSVLSRAEQQGGIGTNTSTQTSPANSEVEHRLAELNQAYEAKYGFRFLVFVNGRSREELVPLLEDRLTHSTRDREIDAALTDTIRIARSRLQTLSSDL